MSNEKYNGWTNYETWNFNLHISNDEGSYHYWTAQASDLDTEQLAAALESNAYDSIEEMPVAFARDIVSRAIARINFTEIAESLKE